MLIQLSTLEIQHVENGEQLKNKYKPCSLSKAVAGKCPAHLEHIKELTEYAEYVLANDPIAGENKYIILFLIVGLVVARAFTVHWACLHQFWCQNGD